MSYLSIACGLLRFGAGLRAFLREPISVDTAKAIIRQRMQARDGAFLQMVERAIFANPKSPYLKLFRAAGCELEDVRTLVRQESVEGTLQKLLQSGIYVTFEEFKGRTAAVRGSQTFSFRDTDFDNPLITPHYYSSTGGTRGTPTRIIIDLDHLAQSAPHWALWFAAHGLVTSPLVFVTPLYPGIVNRQLLCAKFGNRFVKWFSTGGGGSLMYRLVSGYVHSLVRWTAGFPKPEVVPLDEAWRIGEYLVRMVQEGRQPCVITAPSTAIRVCLAMQERGIFLSNVTFLLGAEPLTQARKETIEACGAKAIPTYGFAEGGSVGSQCPNPAIADDVHVSLDAFGVIQHARRLGDGPTVDALLLTALRPACPKVMLNAEIGDYATLETRRCGCLFDAVGYFQHLHTIRSFEKLTGEGVTFAGSDLFHLLEEVLPKRFGGTLADYQLIEEQDARGLPRYILVVSPAVGMLDEKAVVAAFLEELGNLRRPYRFMANLWAQANVIQVKRHSPLLTARGKVLPFHTLGAR